MCDHVQVTSSMAGVVKAMESAMKSMNLEKVFITIIHYHSRRRQPVIVIIVDL